jgi:hypothetical protein
MILTIFNYISSTILENFQKFFLLDALASLSTLLAQLENESIDVEIFTRLHCRCISLFRSREKKNILCFIKENFAVSPSTLLVRQRQRGYLSLNFAVRKLIGALSRIRIDRASHLASPSICRRSAER